MTTGDTRDTRDEQRLRLIIRDEVTRLIERHANNCRFIVDEHPKRLRTIETKFGTLLGFMAGSGLLGGAAGAYISKLIQ